MTETNKRNLIAVLAGFTLFNLVVLWIDYCQFRISMNNPLIPQALIDYRFKVALVLSMPKCTLLILGIYYLVTKKLFWLIAVIYFVLLIGEVLCSSFLITYFVSAN